MLRSLTGEGEEEEGTGVPGWIPPEEVRLLGKLVWGRRKAREKGGAVEEGRYVSSKVSGCPGGMRGCTDVELSVGANRGNAIS